jgi:hypothetical protein
MKRLLLPWLAVGVLIMAVPACNNPSPAADPILVSMVTASPPPPLVAATASLAPTLTRSPSPTETPTSSPTPFGCERPPEDYTVMTLPGEYRLNQRTVWMLERAQAFYGGSHDLIKAITQGSYNLGVDASFGTHDGGGAVDLSLRDLHDWNHILTEDAQSIILALRRAGFAAWVRDVDALYPGSPLHVHAIAIGDAELSPAAQSQLTGPEGYFRGMNGLPDNTQLDPHGGPVLCPWMVEMGYSDLRGDS